MKKINNMFIDPKEIYIKLELCPEKTGIINKHDLRTVAAAQLKEKHNFQSYEEFKEKYDDKALEEYREEMIKKEYLKVDLKYIPIKRIKKEDLQESGDLTDEYYKKNSTYTFFNKNTDKYLTTLYYEEFLEILEDGSLVLDFDFE